MAEFVFSPVVSPDPELVRCYGPDAPEIEVIGHLRQLVDALARGAIGLEWYCDLSRRELARVGW